MTRTLKVHLVDGSEVTVKDAIHCEVLDGHLYAYDERGEILAIFADNRWVCAVWVAA